MRAGAARDLLDGAGVHELEMDGRHVLLGFADTGCGSPYSISLDRNQIVVTINTSSPALKYMANPLFLVGMALSEARAALADKNLGPFISKRDQILSEFLADWSIKPGTPRDLENPFQIPVLVMDCRATSWTFTPIWRKIFESNSSSLRCPRCITFCITQSERTFTQCIQSLEAARTWQRSSQNDLEGVLWL